MNVKQDFLSVVDLRNGYNRACTTDVTSIKSNVLVLILTGSWSGIQGICSQYENSPYPELKLDVSFESLYAYDME